MSLCFLKFSRDRRGYEHFYLVESVTGRRGKTRQRMLYWFRTPPNVKVGRQPFDPHVRRALETRYPEVRFDWEQIRNTPIPSVEPEYWRERRRAERVGRKLQEEEDALAAVVLPSAPLPDAGAPATPDLLESTVADGGPGAGSAETGSAETGSAVPIAVDAACAAPAQAAGDGSVLRRRRRRRRGQRSAGAAGPPGSAGPDQTESPAGASIDAGSEVTDAGEVTDDSIDRPDD
ncbi:MAG: hypothetical protein ABI868_06620 [Acidobacteriota bacterium]